MISKTIIFFLLPTASYLLIASIVHAQADDQRIAELRQQIEQLEKEAEQYHSNIASEQAKAKSLKGDIGILESQIKKIQTQIRITSKNVDRTKIEINNLSENIYDAETSINYKKDTIGRLMLDMYKRDNENLLIILLANLNISNFFNKAQAVANLNANLLEFVSDLKNKKEDLENKKEITEQKKQELENLNQKQKEQNNALSQTRQGKNQLLTQTKGNEIQYQKMLAEIEQKQILFFTELKELETKIIQGGLYITHITAQNLPPKGTKLFQWPEDDYGITQSYGCTAYARCKRARGPYSGAPHNGIDIVSGFGSPIKAIGDGEIIANGKNDGWGSWVAIKHPPYNLVSLYSHMSAFEFLRVGTQVKVGQVIGYEGTTGHVTGSHLHLSVYKDFFTYLNEKNGQLYFNYFDGSINPLDYLQ